MACSLLLIILVLLLLMLMPMLMMLALTLMLLLDALYVAAYAVADNADTDAKIPNDACHLVGSMLCC